MGNTYGHIAVKAPRERVAVWLGASKVPSFLSPQYEEWCLFLDEDTGNQVLRWTRELLVRLTGDLTCTALAQLVYDDEWLNIIMANNGEIVSFYHSRPGMEYGRNPPLEDFESRLDGGEHMTSVLGFADAPHRLLDCLHVAPDEYKFCTDIHEEFNKIVGLPVEIVGVSYRDLLRAGGRGAGAEFTAI